MATSFSKLVRKESPLVLPGAFDALSARLIERAGFEGLFVGGFASLGARHAVPDVGLMGLAEISAVIRDIRKSTSLPMMVDADDGYGDVKNVVHTVQTYARMGIQAIFMEDQQSPKRCGHLAGKSVVSAEVMEAKLRAAVGERDAAGPYIVARTDAGAVLGMDEALRRGERYLRAGADAIYIEAPETVEELALIGRHFKGEANMTSMLEGGKTPILKPSDLHEMGYNIIIFGTTLLMRAAKVMITALDDIKSERLELVGTGVSLKDYFDLVDLQKWSGIEQRYELET